MKTKVRKLRTRHSSIIVTSTPGKPDRVEVHLKANCVLTLATKPFTKKEQYAYDWECAIKENAERDSGTYAVRKIFETLQHRWSPDGGSA